MAPVIARGVLRFGLVSIPIDIHSAIEDQSIRMHLLHKKCGSMHFMYFANEVHDFDQIPKAQGEKVPQREIDLGRDLIDKMSAEEFQLEKYRERFLAMVDQKTKDKEITVAPLRRGGAGTWWI
jgi:non-homologous end joining protein Ku